MHTGIIRDDRCFQHMPGNSHPEGPSRLQAVYDMLDRGPGGMVRIPVEVASIEELALVHTPGYIQQVLRTSEQAYTLFAPETPVSSGSCLAARTAVGACLRGLDALMEKRCEACFCLIRPPGHHAGIDSAAGFCIFNNLAVTARYAAMAYGLSRILVIDWDIHHGNGIQDIFYADPSVFYFSSHDLLLYPHSGAMEEMGVGEGTGYTLNIPLPKRLEDRDILWLYRELLTPVVRRYRPELILVAAGFDAHRADPLGRSRMTTQGYGELARLLVRLVREAGSPPLLLALEGGYHRRYLPECIREVLDVLRGPDPGAETVFPGSSQTEHLAARIRELHAGCGVWA